MRDQNDIWSYRDVVNICDKIAINKAFPIATNKGFNFNKGVEPLSFVQAVNTIVGNLGKFLFTLVYKSTKKCCKTKCTKYKFVLAVYYVGLSVIITSKYDFVKYF